MIKLTAKGKFIDTREMEHLLTQGEKCSDIIYFVLDAKNNDVDITDCIFVLRTAASDGSMSETVLAKTAADEQIILMWNIPETATAVPGMLRLELIGTKSEETVIKFQMHPVYVKDAVMGYNIPVPDVVESKLLQMNELLEKAKEIEDKFSEDSGIVQEVTDARKGIFDEYTYSTLSQRLSREFSLCVQRSFFEDSLKAIIAEANNTGAGRFWKDSDGNICGEIFNDYNRNTASGIYSHAGGNGTIAASDNQYVFGAYNLEDTENKYVHIIGNGTSDSERSNALTVDWNGNLHLTGDVAATDSNGQTVSIINLQARIDALEAAVAQLGGSV